MNIISKLFCLVLGCLIVNQVSAQKQFTIGPSVVFNVAFFEGDIYTVFGGQVAYEIPVKDNHSLNIAGTIHYGEHINAYDFSITERDLLVGLHPEYRFHFDERYKGSYLGVGGDVKHLTAKNYFSPTPTDPEPTFVAWEFNIGISYGAYIPVGDRRALNPFVYLAGNPLDVNEYGLSLRFGFNVTL